MATNQIVITDTYCGTCNSFIPMEIWADHICDFRVGKEVDELFDYVMTLPEGDLNSSPMNVPDSKDYMSIELEGEVFTIPPLDQDLDEENIHINTNVRTDESFVIDQPEQKISKPLAAEKTSGHQCDQCSNYFKYPSTLKRHQSRVHGMKKFDCVECSKKFSTSSDLKRHQITHKAMAGKMPFQCDKCDKSFRDRYDLKRHEDIHTGQKRFTCNQCDYKCHQASGLNGHKKLKHRKPCED